MVDSAEPFTPVANRYTGSVKKMITRFGGASHFSGVTYYGTGSHKLVSDPVNRLFWDSFYKGLRPSGLFEASIEKSSQFPLGTVSGTHAAFLDHVTSRGGEMDGSTIHIGEFSIEMTFPLKDPKVYDSWVKNILPQQQKISSCGNQKVPPPRRDEYSSSATDIRDVSSRLAISWRLYRQIPLSSGTFRVPS